MSFGAARKTVDTAGGIQLAGGQDFVFVNNHLWVLLGDPVEAHGFPPHSPPPPMVESSSFVEINGIPVCREGNAAACGHQTTGSGNVRLSG